MVNSLDYFDGRRRALVGFCDGAAVAAEAAAELL
jgi:dienelactone hydrolase